MIGRVLAIVALAVLAGLALALRDLVLPPPRQVPLPLESLVEGLVRSAFGFGETADSARNPPGPRPVPETFASTRPATAEVRATPACVSAILSGSWMMPVQQP